MKSWLVVGLCVFSISAHSAEYSPLYNSNATLADFVSVCSAVNVPLTSADVDSTSVISVDAAWTIVAKQQQCYSYITGIIRGSSIHHIIMNKKLNRSAGDTTYGSICMVDQGSPEVALTLLTLVQQGVQPNKQKTYQADIFVYAALSELYPCPIDPST